MNNYYRMRLSSDPKVIGVRSGRQTQILQDGFSDKELYRKIFDFFNSKEYWTRTEKEPKFDVELQCAKAYKNTKITSFLSFSPVLMDCPFLISDEVRECLGRFEIQKHYLYRASVLFKDQELSYWLYYMPPLGHDVIDFKGCVFYSGNPISGKKYHSVIDQFEYRELCIGKAINLQSEKISLNEHFDKSLDLFETKMGGIFVSERLRSEFLRSGFTGVNFIPTFGDNLNQVMIKTN